MYESLDNLEQNVLEKIADGNLDSALQFVRAFVELIISNEFCTGILFGSATLDKLCLKIGSVSAASRKISLEKLVVLNEELIVYVATKLYVSGGHTAVLEDFIRLQPDKKHVILITDIWEDAEREKIEDRFHGVAVIEWALRGTLLDKLVWLQERLCALIPEKIFLLNHHQDVVAIAAAQPDLPSKVYFFHHADHQLCLGVCLEHVIHIDAHSTGFFICRENLGVNNNVYWPLTAVDKGARHKNIPFMLNNKLNTCSSGSPHKFEMNYPFHYIEMLPKILNATSGTHVHIGGLSPSTLDKIYKALDRDGIARDRFILVPWVKSLWQALIEHKIDLYISSFPHGGGKASVEVMGSGTPLVVHQNYRSEVLGGQGLAYPEAYCWKKPDELINYLIKLTPDFLVDQSRSARRHYERYHHPDILKNKLTKNSLEAMDPLVPTHRSYQQDTLQVYLDMCNEFNMLRQERDSLKRDLSFIYNSKLWYVIKYLRIIVNKIRALKTRENKQ